MRISGQKNYLIQPIKRKDPMPKLSDDNKNKQQNNSKNKENSKKSKFDFYA